MILKKFYGPGIKEARQKAQDELGKQCVILETVDASDGQPASVTVMMDKKKQAELKAAARNEGESFGDPNTSGNDDSNGNDMADSGRSKGTYSRRDMLPKALKQVKEAVTEGAGYFASVNVKENEGTHEHPAMSRTGNSLLQKKQSNTADDTEEENDMLTMSRRSVPLYKKSSGLPDPEAGDFRERFNGSLRETPVSKEVKALHRRFDHMEMLLSDALISANLEYVSHPAFQQLLNTGMQATTVSKWFESILKKGIDPYEQQQSFMYELAEIVRTSLTFSLPESPEKNLLFVGPSGSGKSTLIMKLASNPDFMGEKSVALVSVEPASGFKRYSQLKLFADDAELPFYTVRDGVDMTKLLPELEDFDHVLFDTPSISLQQKAAFRDFWRIRQLLTSVAPLEVHYVINATLERYYFKETYAENHPLQPDYIAITHLDETDKWGHLLPFLKSRGCSVRYVCQGPHIPDDLYNFNPSWFAEKILSHS